ncbi:hypothetical protein GCM10011504_30140 [Siccirubricoccus deserti]|nr:hypothetical protein GCM10011504_30140 [Siccirubricoccus deserti]
MRVQRGADLADNAFIQLGGDIDAGDLGADRAGDRLHADTTVPHDQPPEAFAECSARREAAVNADARYV